MKINIGLAISRDWFSKACITATSILLKSKPQDDYCFYIVSNGFNNDEKELFLKLKKIRNVEFKFLVIDDDYFEGAIHDWLGVSASYRLRLQSLCNEDKILYLDSDIVAVEDIAAFYKTDISDYYLAAVEDKCSQMMRGRTKKIQQGEIFFNSGVQLINLSEFRKNNIEEKMLTTMRECSFYTDQDAMNDVCYGKILSLPLKYNIVPDQNGYKDRQEEAKSAMREPVLYHYWSKPWSTTSRQEGYKYWNEVQDTYDAL